MPVSLIILVVPLLLMAALAFLRQPARLPFWLYVMALGLAVVYMWLVFPWDIISIWYRRLVPVLLVLAVYSGYRRIRQPATPPPRWQTMLNVSVNVLLIVMMGTLTAFSIKGYAKPAGGIDLASPLRDGHFIVGNGGSSPFINGHARVKPQNHALDILALNKWGSRRIPFSDPKDLNNYAIYDLPLYSPCEGEVLFVVDGLPDMIPPASDRKQLAGNHVLIACMGVEIVLAHMKKGSVEVMAGQTVDTQTVLGRVGNSGNTSEPHLHIHAKAGGSPSNALEGDAVPITIEGRYLVRGSTF